MENTFMLIWDGCWFYCLAQAENSDEWKRRRLRVIACIRKHQQPELWPTVSDDVLVDGELDISGVTINDQVLQDVTYLFNSPVANNITEVK